jgi:hypothetical protein
MTHQKELDRLVKQIKGATKKSRVMFNNHDKAVKQIENYELSLFYIDD